MSEENKVTKNCGGKKKTMLVYGLIQLSSTFISAVALVAIAFGFCALNKEAKVFNECVEESIDSGLEKAYAVHFCNGGDAN